jgi:hypothetical protein
MTKYLSKIIYKEPVRKYSSPVVLYRFSKIYSEIRMVGMKF